ncbi:MAG: hypothetical protein RID07_21065 [Lacipirellulaceae bacterium]
MDDILAGSTAAETARDKCQQAPLVLPDQASPSVGFSSANRLDQ